MVLQNIIVLGSSGGLGPLVMPALIKAGFSITLLKRPGGKVYTSESQTFETKEAAFGDVSALTQAFQGQDAVILICNPAAMVYTRNFVQAALAAGVKHLITNEFGMPTLHPNAMELPTNHDKVAAQKVLLEELQNNEASGKPVKLSWTGIFTGMWFDWAMHRGFWIIKPEKHSITRYGSGNQKLSISRGDLNGQVLVHVLRNPGRYQNRGTYFASHTISANETIEILEEISGEGVWKVEDVPDVKGLMDHGFQLWEEDKQRGVEDWMHTQAFLEINLAAFFDEGNRWGCNYEDVVEPGWDEGREGLKETLKALVGKLAA